MSKADPLDPYAGNILCSGLNPIRSRGDVLKALMDLPPVPSRLRDIPRHIRLHHLMRLREFHIPELVEGRLFEGMDLHVRGSYRDRDPATSPVWGALSGEQVVRKRPGLIASALMAQGISGSGKTEAAYRCMGCLSAGQVIVHDSFPRIVGPHMQVVWLSVDVPPSGKAEDLARALMLAWAIATRSDRFATYLAQPRFKNPMQALEEWRQVAGIHFLGLLHLDEVQNFFKIGTLEQRRKRTTSAGASPALSIVEDECLKWILTLLNTWGIPVAFSGTPDGVGALTSRFATMQRFSTGGYYEFSPFAGIREGDFLESFLTPLGRYQYVINKLPVDNTLAQKIVSLSGGIQRVIIALWIGANRIALERETDDLRLEDFDTAFNSFLAPLGPAIAALKSRDSMRLSRYEDLVFRDQSFWPRFWQNVAA